MEDNKKNKVNKALMVGTGLIALSAAVAPQANAASATGNMTAEILTPIVLAVPTDIQFGSMTVATGAGDTVTLDTAGSRTVAGANVTLVAGAITPAAGVVSVSGAIGPTIRLQMDATTYNVTRTAGPETMVVNNFQISTAAGGTQEDVILAASPTTFPIGADLVVGAGQEAGSYTGVFTINASYQ